MKAEHRAKPVSSAFCKRRSARRAACVWTIFFKPAKTCGTCGIREDICKLNCWEIQNIYSSPRRWHPYCILSSENAWTISHRKYFNEIFHICHFLTALWKTLWDQEDWITQSWISHIYPGSFETNRIVGYSLTNRLANVCKLLPTGLKVFF